MTMLSLEEVQAHLPELIDKLVPGEEVVITRGEKPVAQLISFSAREPQPRFGSCRGMLTIISEDDDHLADFQDYMP